MSVQITGDFLTINEKITVKISEIQSIKPRSLVSYEEYTGKIIAKDFPKVIINTTQEELEVLYSTDEERDIALTEIRKSIAEYTSKIENLEKQSSINIKVTDSSNVNIVSQSKEVEINQEIKDSVNSQIAELIKQLDELKDIDKELKTDILDCVSDIQNNLNNNKKVPKYSLKSLIDLTSKIVSLSSLGIGIAQLLGG